jgi:lipopolysaccharide/colanic/teichoic acid biosynthesis glycosyltransferase
VSVDAVARTMDRPETVRNFSVHSLVRNMGCEGMELPAWKRVLDLIIGITALVLFSPLMLVAACLIRMTSHGPVLFRQTRVGHGGRLFEMLKFRTMICAPPTQQQEDIIQRQVYYRELIAGAQPDPDTGLFRTKQDPRVTKIGEFLRLFSIDELPQLMNVVRGEMSLVGPRPALQWEAEMLTADQRRRHAVPPGMTGLWQVSGRNRISSLDMIKIDLEYVERLSLWLDLWVLARTPWVVLFQRYTR